ncbi:class I SAM-dependent methyltransferase [Methylophaga sp. OBS4]|uniref:class I SAM-dependent methyltransferase n=1 Tax=Methylophaga sp. OBS4 TaxID=2991935 RepID=UPI0022594013|nr:methyltransferase domain-containing protein [Methylophaga sp. OBS4]MCX4187832.1 class I SAM-dependent methyltransferase [Methylophaga sp. OBS4]
MALTKEAIRGLYRKRAGWYDFSANAYYLIGFRETKYRKMAVSELALEVGDTVIEIGCGTGLNFKYLLQSIGNTGHLIGVDLTDAMLEKAKQRVERSGWENVQLVQSDAAKYVFPSSTKGVISTLALTLIPDYEAIIKRAANSLVSGGRFVILDLKKPERWPLWMAKIGVAITKPFGVSLDLTEQRPWEVMNRYFKNVTMTEVYGGFVYIAVGRK